MARTLRFTLRVSTVLGDGDDPGVAIHRALWQLQREGFAATLDGGWHTETDDGDERSGDGGA